MKLYLIPTPIGNLEDMTLRALRILGEVDGILAEDTRNTGQLLKHLNISKPLFSHHAHNEHAGVAGVIKMLKEGKVLALVSDAGTPGISDPGFLLTRACIEKGIEVECLPGATAFVPALVKSGFALHCYNSSEMPRLGLELIQYRGIHSVTLCRGRDLLHSCRQPL